MKIKFLIIRFSSIGDIVLTTPVVRCLKKQVEQAEVHFLTKKVFEPIISSNPYVDKVHTYSDNLNDTIRNLKNEQIDYIIDLHNNIRSSRIKQKLKMPSFSFNKLNFEKFLLTNFKIDRMPQIHIVDRYLETLSVFDVKNDGEGLDFFIPENNTNTPPALPASFKRGYIAFSIAGTWNTKILPADKVVEICSNISFPVILLGGGNEETAGEEIAAECGSHVINMAGKTNLFQSAALVRNARIVLTNDTGLMHIAAAFKKKILSFWGNTVPAFGMTPYMADNASYISEVNGLNCRPCSKIGYDKCPKKHFRCMKDQDVKKTVDWINKNFGD